MRRPVSKGARRSMRFTYRSFIAASLLLGACGGEGGGGGAVMDAGADGAVMDAGADGAVTKGCSSDAACADGSSCVGGKCVADTTEARVTIDPKARGCELLVEQTGSSTTASASFGTSLLGSYVARAPRMGVSFVAKTDAPISGDEITLTFSGADSFALVKSRCVDAKGKALAGSAVELAP